MHAESVANLFTQYFYVVGGNTPEIRRTACNIRYQVYCQEFKYELEENCPNQMESDEYDAQSDHCLLIHNHTHQPAGCVRLIRSLPNKPNPPLPFARFCKQAFDKEQFDPAHLPLGAFVEISRLAVTAQFRRRKYDEHKPVSLPHEQTTEPGNIPGVDHQRHRFPFIPIGLVLSAFTIILRNDYKYSLAMMETRLANMLGRYGLIWTQVGEVMDYHGPRAPFVVYNDKILPNLESKPEVYELMQVIKEQLDQKIPLMVNR